MTWLSPPTARLVVCDCACAPELDVHYRVDGLRQPARKEIA
jgi:hypothetical protein